MENHCFLAYCMACSVGFLMPVQGGTAHIELGPPISIINQDNVPKTCLQADLVERIPWLRFPSS